MSKTHLSIVFFLAVLLTAGSQAAPVSDKYSGEIQKLSPAIPKANVVDLTIRLVKGATNDVIKAKIQDAANGQLKGIFPYNDEEVLSTDFLSETYLFVFDPKAGFALNDNFLKLVSWYNNEFAYSKRVTDEIKNLQSEDKATRPCSCK